MKSKEWNIILSSGPNEKVKRLRVSKILIRNTIISVAILPLIIIGLLLHTNKINHEKEELHLTIKEKDSQIEERALELESVQKEYNELQEEALAVQNTIEEF